MIQLTSVILQHPGKVDTLAFANFSQMLGKQTRKLAVAGAFRQVTLDYSKQEVSWSSDARQALGQKLVRVGRVLEDAFGGAQDVEGGLIGDQVFVVQTRPQP